MSRIDKRWNIVVCFMMFLAAGGLAFPQPMGQDDVRLIGKAAWLASSPGGKIAFANGVLTGAYTVVMLYVWENKDKGIAPIYHLVPQTDADTLVMLVDLAYSHPEYRDWPVAQLMVRYKEVAEYLRRKLNAY